MTAAFNQRHQDQVIADLLQWYAPATTESRSKKGRYKRMDRQDKALRVANKYFEAMDYDGHKWSNPANAVASVGPLLYPILWPLVRPFVMAWLNELVEWLWKRTR